MATEDGIDAVIARLASRAHGLVTRVQLLGAGVSADAIKTRVSRRSLIRVHRGVYRVGHIAPSLEATYLGAVLAHGPDAWLAGRAAGFLLGIIEGTQPGPRVWAPTARRVQGVITRRYRAALGPRETGIYRGIPVTTPARTLLDLAPTLSLDALARCFHEARIKHRTKEPHVLEMVERHPKAPGRLKLKAVLLGDLPVTLNRYELEFRRVLAGAGLPLPDESNRRAGSGFVDCRYRDPPLTIELDSYGYHASRHQFEADRRREREAYARGDQHRRYTYGDVFEDTTPMLAELRTLLAHRIDPTWRWPWPP